MAPGLKRRSGAGASGTFIWLAGSILAISAATLAPLAGVLAATAAGLLAATQAAAPLLPSPARGSRAGALVRILARYELAILLAGAPFFLFPQPRFIFVLLLVPLQQLVRWRAQAGPTRASPFNLPILLLFVMLVPAFWLADPLTALPKLAGLVFGLALYLAILNAPWPVEAGPLQLLLMAQCLALTLAALLATDWLSEGKLTWFNAIYERLPRLDTLGLPPINSNESGGALAWVVPFLLASWLRELRTPLFSLGPPARAAWRVLLGLALALSGLALFLTQSRSAIAAALIAMAVMVLLWAPRPSRRLLPAALGLAFVAVLAWLLAGYFGGSQAMLDGREGVWQAALYLIGHYPIAGVGLGMFDAALAAHNLRPYPPLLLPFAHAHNEFLQSAIDFGLPGLLAFSMLLGVAGITWRRLMRNAAPDIRPIVLAVGCGLLAHQIFGLVDAIALGGKPGFIFWSLLACLARLGSDHELAAVRCAKPRQVHRGGSASQ